MHRTKDTLNHQSWVDNVVYIAPPEPFNTNTTCNTHDTPLCVPTVANFQPLSLATS